MGTNHECTVYPKKYRIYLYLENKKKHNVCSKLEVNQCTT